MEKGHCHHHQPGGASPRQPTTGPPRKRFGTLSPPRTAQDAREVIKGRRQTCEAGSHHAFRGRELQDYWTGSEAEGTNPRDGGCDVRYERETKSPHHGAPAHVLFKANAELA